MKTIRNLYRKISLMKGVLAVTVCLAVFCLGGFVSQAAEGTVLAETAKIRAQADGNSEVVGSTVKGKVIDIVGAEADSAGVKWYKVPIANNGYGFIRSDLVKTNEEIVVSAGSSSSTSQSDGGSAPAATVPTAISEQSATVTPASVKVRSGASTNHGAIGSLPQGTAITLIGEANDSAGKKWYQITCNHEGKNIEGYIRSDLVTLGAAAPEQPADGGTAPEGESSEGDNPEGEGSPEGENPEGENPEGGEPEPAPEEAPQPEHNDYEVVYNEDTYWLYDNTNGTMMKVQDLLNVVNQANTNSAELEKQVQNEKIIIIVLAVIVVILVIVITVLLLKIRDLYYEDYEDEEEEEEEEEEEPEPVVRKKRRIVPAEEEPQEPVRRKRPAPAVESEERIRPAREKQPKPRERAVRQEPAEEPELQAAERRPVKKAAPRKAQNFLLDDDEFEFEFLNMDDKDL